MIVWDKKVSPLPPFKFSLHIMTSTVVEVLNYAGFSTVNRDETTDVLCIVGGSNPSARLKSNRTPHTSRRSVPCGDNINKAESSPEGFLLCKE